MSTAYYFAYGSNMLTERLQARCPSAAFVGTGSCVGYQFRYSKKGNDGTGKATLISATNADVVRGAIYELSVQCVDALNAAEGVGTHYEQLEHFFVQLDSGQTIDAMTYVACSDRVETGLLPADWYHWLVIAGALQTRLDTEYIEHVLQADRPVVPARGKAFSDAVTLLSDAGFAWMCKS